jgi:hypothetical protein
VGWVLSAGETSTVAQSLRSLMSDDSAMQQMRDRCFRVYQQHFSRAAILDGWHRELLALAAPQLEQ